MVSLTESPIVLRSMELADLETAIELSQEQSWPHRREDWQFLYGLGEGIVANIDDRVVGSIMSWRYGGNYATLGNVIVTGRAAGMDRSVLLEALSCDASGIVLSRHHDSVGFGLLRRFGRGSLIGPIVAHDLDGAKVLATHWMSARAGRFCRMDVVEGYGMSRWLEEMGLPKVGSVTTMVRGTAPAVMDGPRVFGLATQVLG